jgi:hypothetical protein
LEKASIEALADFRLLPKLLGKSACAFEHLDMRLPARFTDFGRLAGAKRLGFKRQA